MALFASLALLAAVVSANSIEDLNFQCVPCIAFGGYYCFDDPWKVNFNGDKCYEYAVDRVSCSAFNYTNDISDCYGTILTEADKCKVAREKFELFDQPLDFEI